MIAGLPYDAEVEYIESTGTQWIDTGYVPNSTTAFELSAAYTGNDGNYNRLFGTQKDGTGKTLTIRSGYAQGVEYYVESGSGAFYGIFDTDKHTFSFSDGAAYIDGVMLFSNRPPSNQITGSAWLWGNNNVEQRHARAKVYLCKLQDGTTLVRDLIPVRFTNELGQSEGAMYDRVSRKLFRNAGTGAFTIGPDVATPVMGLHFMKQIPKYTAKSYVQDGLVAMWDGIENVGYMKHSDSSETWNDLTGNGNDAEIVKSENYIRAAPFDSVAARMDGTFSFSFTPSDEIISAMMGDCTIEIVAGIGVPTFIDSVPFISLGDYAASVMEMSGAPNNFKARPFINNEVQSSGMGYPFNQCAFTKSMSGASAMCRCYYKGGMINSAERTYQNVSTSTGWLFGSSTGFFGGKGRWWDSGDDGYAYGLRVYSRALTAEELAKNYEIDKERFNLP